MVVIRQVIKQASKETRLTKKQILNILKEYEINGHDFYTIGEFIYFVKNPHDWLLKSRPKYKGEDPMDLVLFDKTLGFIYFLPETNSIKNHFYNDKKQRVKIKWNACDAENCNCSPKASLLFWNPKNHKYFNEDEKVNIKIMFKYLSQYFPKEIIYEILYKL